MKKWKAVVKGASGREMRILSVYAATEVDAQMEARRQLNRPGRLNIFFEWCKQGGMMREIAQ